jgi:SAM-dependent methyltransferase
MTDTMPPNTTETPGIVTGNHHDKYESGNPAIRFLTRRFLDRLDGILDGVAAESPRGRVLEVGCGEGLIAERLMRRWPNVTALDLPDVAVEVMEHLTEPRQGLAEMARVSTGHLVLSVPREPIFRGANMAGGRHLSDWGNTPGHLNHWSTPSFLKFVSQEAGIRAVEKPLPWTMVWARTG